MFTQHIPRTGSPDADHNFLTRASAATGALALGVGIALVPLSANAEEPGASFAAGQFVSGTLAGTDLATVVALEAAVALNDGTQPLQTSDDPLHVSALQSVEIEREGGIQTNLSEYVDAGTLNQYAEADRNGLSLGASGAIGDDGAIGSGPVTSGAAGDVDVDLDATLDDQYADVLHNLTLSLDAIAARAEGNVDTAIGDYRIEGAVLTFTSPAIGDLTAKVNAALDSVDSDLAELEGPGGALSAAVHDILNPVLGIVGSSANVSVDIDADVHDAVQPLLTGLYGDDAVRFNLQTGTVSVDLEALLGGNLNELPPNTELLSAEVIGPVLKSIADTVTSLADQIAERVEASLHDATVTVHANLDLVSEQGSMQDQLCRDEQVPIVGSILNGITQEIVGYTTETVCTLVTTALPALHSTLNLHITGTVDQLLSGAAAKSSASVSLLDGTVNAGIDMDGIIHGLGEGLAEGLFGTDGAVSGLVDILDLGLVTPAADGLLGETGVGTALTEVLSVKANVQETGSAGGDSTFTQTAVRVSALDGQLTTLSLASATVGPNVTRVIDPGCTIDCSPGVIPDPCVNCGVGNLSTLAMPTQAGTLAYTGMGVANLLGAVLALLAAGAFMARESYRKSHPSGIRVSTGG